MSKGPQDANVKSNERVTHPLGEVLKIQRLGLILVIICSAAWIWLSGLGSYGIVRASDAINLPLGNLDQRVSSQSSWQSVISSHTPEITSTSSFTVYLPFISKIIPRVPSGIYGQITYQGTPMSGIKVSLYRCNNNGAYWVCPSADVQYTTTFADGSYQFTAAQSLGPNQKYVVLQANSNPNYLSVSWGPDIFTYTAGQTISGGSFDIANIPLLSPADAITAGLPIVFRWAPRATTPLDSYHIVMWNIANESISWQSPPLGYVGSYTMTTLPNNFTTGVRYAWLIEVFNNGGTGDSQETRTITFSSSSQK